MYFPSACRAFHRRLILTAVLLLLGGMHTAAQALDAVTLQLKWSHAFQFAGYYAAKEKGYYREAGLDVTIRPAAPGDDAITPVLDGTAQYGVGTSSLLREFSHGKDIPHIIDSARV